MHTALLPASCVQCDVKMECFDLVDAETLRKVVAERKSSMGSLDPNSNLPFRTIFTSVSKDILAIVNDSLRLVSSPLILKLL